MVAGHSNVPFIKFIYLFHMAVFFMASGYFFNDHSVDTISGVLSKTKSKILSLWVPFFIFNTLCILLHNFFIRINVYTDNPQLFDYVSGMYIGTTRAYGLREMLELIIRGILLDSNQQVFGTSWFFKILFLVNVSYLLIAFIIRKVFKTHLILIQTIISILLLAFGYYCYNNGITIYGFAQTASFYCLYHMGYLFKYYKEFYINKASLHCFVLIISFSLLLVLNNLGSISLNNNRYTNPLFFIIASVSGWCLLYSAAFLLKPFSLLKKC